MLIEIPNAENGTHPANRIRICTKTSAAKNPEKKFAISFLFVL